MPINYQELKIQSENIADKARRFFRGVKRLDRNAPILSTLKNLRNCNKLKSNQNFILFTKSIKELNENLGKSDLSYCVSSKIFFLIVDMEAYIRTLEN